jgi:hypothetical protein
MTVQERIGMPMEEFIRLYDEAPFELVNGERILLVPPVAVHIIIIKRLMVIFLAGVIVKVKRELRKLRMRRSHNFSIDYRIGCWLVRQPYRA